MVCFKVADHKDREADNMYEATERAVSRVK